ncbi:hypothetical protein OC846_003073 [Tilletia horrida]|uniref:N-acetyltransferase domain-containing protein n=1 Tax=Tilletia horrida TaxID=155126 RepID=A0AAN6JRL6_9BASI|nr:hypothetical protein OC846_003073 [Tilletia horrida]KAK0566166.1 hypothetical protein OC861_003387 [Tilletia horrida]
MSAYGAILRSNAASAGSLPATLWPTRDPSLKLSVHHLTLSSALALPLDASNSSLLDHLRSTFADLIEQGRTYPQEDIATFQKDGKGFESYFFAADVFIGVLEREDDASVGAEMQGTEGKFVSNEPGSEASSVEKARKGRLWKEAVAGFYYVKPNYPGRSSHICNGGFVVVPIHRGLSLGLTLGKSYLYYAPKLGYKGSVFNLVYVNNVASVKIWDRLGFTRAGLIPQAGRLRCAGEQGERGEEEYVDAIVFYKSFE